MKVYVVILVSDMVECVAFDNKDRAWEVFDAAHSLKPRPKGVHLCAIELNKLPGALGAAIENLRVVAAQGRLL